MFLRSVIFTKASEKQDKLLGDMLRSRVKIRFWNQGANRARGSCNLGPLCVPRGPHLGHKMFKRPSFLFMLIKTSSVLKHCLIVHLFNPCTK